MSQLISENPMSDTLDIPVTPVATPDWAAATRLMEQAVKAGNQDPQALYLLAMGYKHQGRVADARHVLGKIADPDANVLLQRGVLAFAEKDFARAGEEFARAWDLDPTSYPAAYNLMLTRLCQGQLEECVALLARLAPLAPTPAERNFLGLVDTLLRQSTTGPLTPEQERRLGTMQNAEEERLLDMIVGLNQFDVVFALLYKLVALRPHSDPAFKAYVGAALVQAKQLMDRFHWEEASSLLVPLLRRLDNAAVRVDPMHRVVLCCMLGTCACMMQEFERGVGYFRHAQDALQQGGMATNPRAQHVQGVPQAAWLEQNLALAHEWQGRLDVAEQHWNRYFDLLEQNFKRSMPPEYLATLAFEGCSRLAELYQRKERVASAVAFLQRAHRVRPADYEVLERLFHLFNQLRRFDEARRVLRRLREVRPNDPQAELFELEVREVRKLDEVDQVLADLRRLMQRFPNDTRVEERAGTLVTNLVPVLEKVADQYAGQVNKVVDQMRRLPSYQINWPTVRDIMRDLEDKYLFLRRVAQKCLSHVTSEDTRRDLNRLIAHCDRKIDQCHSLGE
jgi:tetratricopeptide (TPR) repeat protein